ncbi:Coiled-coil domain-containing protein 40 [Oopsacas minuta]|uniref:Coiled-coil domain-containing protein 40 n=1 Tax=Oopsacas minuta TaxID=111878 RepID=A0AAV7JWW1_9METZ|nr:Coiled-coil domain-containing protein 40 [Oopsacas minuta]
MSQLGIATTGPDPTGDDAYNPVVQYREEQDVEYEQDDDEGEEEDMLVLAPEHPLMRRVQEALKTQLTKKKEELRLQLYAEKEELKAAQKDREDVGVELYTIQQQLAKQQSTLESVQDEVADLSEKRNQEDRLLKDAREQHTKMIVFLTQRQKEEVQMRKEAEEYASEVRMMENALQATKIDLAVTKRATDKALGDVAKAEEQKVQQDFYVDWLTDKVQKLRETIDLQQAQELAQTDQTRQVRDLLTQASTELEVLRLEKKQILQQWNSSLVGMQRRDEALAGIQQVRQENQDKLNTMHTEMSSYKRSIKQTQEKNEMLTGLVRLTDHELATLKKQLEVNAQQREALRIDYGTYTRTLHETEQQLQRANTDKILKENQLKALRTQSEREALEKIKLEDSVMETVMTQLTIDKASQRTGKDIDMSRKQVRELQSSAIKLENNIATKDLELSKHSSQLKELTKILESYEKKLQGQNVLISRCEQEIHKQNTLIDRKQTKIDQLNKMIDKIISGREGAEQELGPLELTINQLTKQVQASVEESQKLQNFWLREQSEMVRIVTSTQEQKINIDKLIKQMIILDQKKLRLDSNFEQEKVENREVAKSMSGLRKDMSKLHELLTHKRSEQENLEQGNLLIENDFIHSLKDAELESIRLQSQLNEVKEEKVRIVRSIIEAEEQVMLWEKKISLARETKDMLQKDYGEEEIQGMKAEIHRMHVRYDQLKRQQEKLIQDMEKAVYRREAIEKKGDAQLKSGKGETTGQLQLKLDDMKRKIVQTEQKTIQTEQQLKHIQDSQNILGDKLESTQTTCLELHDASSQLDQQIEDLTREKQKNLSIIVALQNRTKQLDYATQGKYPTLCKNPANLDSELEMHTQRTQLLFTVMDQLGENFPEKQGEIRHVRENMLMRTQVSNFIRETLPTIEK